MARASSDRASATACPWSEVVEALRLLTERRAHGKVVVELEPA